MISMYILKGCTNSGSWFTIKNLANCADILKNKYLQGYIQTFQNRVINKPGDTSDNSGQRVDHVTSTFLKLQGTIMNIAPH